MGVKLTADVSQYKRAMDEASQAVRALGNESKLADSELRKSGDTQAYVEQKTSALTRQIQAQERAVSAAEKGLAAAARAYGQNSTQVQQWQSRLAQARTALNNFQADLREVQTGTDRMQRSLQGGAQATRELGQIANATKFTALMSGINAVEQKMNSLSNTARRVAQSVWRSASESAAWADELATSSSRYGVDARTLQQWQYAANFVDVEVSTITGASNRLLSAISSNSAALSSLGVAMRDSAGGMRSTQEVFWDTIEALGRMSDETERDAQAQAIFGKSFADLVPLVEAGRQAWQDYCDEAERAGLVLSEDQVAGLNSFNDSMDRMHATIAGLKNSLIADLAPGFEAISQTVTEAVQSILQWTHTAEGQQAINSLTQAIQNLVHSMADGGLQALIHGITDAVTALGDAANWAAQHSDALMPLLTLAVGGRSVGGLALGGLRMASSIKTLFGLGSAGTAAAGAAGGTAAAGTAGAAAGSGLLATAGTALAGFGLGIGSMAGLAALAREAGTVHHQTGLEAETARTNARLAAQGVAAGSLSASQEERQAALRRQQERQTQAEQEAVEAFNAAVEELVQGWRENGEQDSAEDTMWRARMSEWAENLTQRDITDAIEAARLSWNQQQQEDSEPPRTEIEANVEITGEALTVALHDSKLSFHEYSALVEYVQEHMTPAVEQAKALIGEGWTEVAREMQTRPTQEEFDAARPVTEREALEFFALTNFVKGEMQTDLENATGLAAELWVQLVSTCSTPAGLNQKLASMTGQQAHEAGDVTFTAMVDWVQSTMGVDRDNAIRIAIAMWDEMRKTATNPANLEGEYHWSGSADATFYVMQDWIREHLGDDRTNAESAARDLWRALIENCGDPTALGMKLSSMTGQQAKDSGDSTFQAMTQWAMETLGMDQEEAEAYALAMWEALAHYCQHPDEVQYAKYGFVGSVDANAVTAMRQYVEQALGKDSAEALLLAQGIWAAMLTAAGDPVALGVKLRTLTGAQAQQSGDTTFTALVEWVRTNVTSDETEAVEVAKGLWDAMVAYVQNPTDVLGEEFHYTGASGQSTAFQEAVQAIFGDDYEAALAMLETMYGKISGGPQSRPPQNGYNPNKSSINPNSYLSGLRSDIQRLEQIRDQLNQFLVDCGELFTEEGILSLDIPEDVRAYLLGLLAEADRLAGRISWYESDQARAGAGAYEMAMQGIDLEENMFDAFEYLNQTRDHELELVDQEIGRLGQEARTSRLELQKTYQEAQAAEEAAARAEGREFNQENVNNNPAVQAAEQATHAAEEARDAAIAAREERRREIMRDYTEQVAALLNRIGIAEYGYTGDRRPAPREVEYTPTAWEQFVSEHPELVPALGSMFNEEGEVVTNYGTGQPVTQEDFENLIDPTTGQRVFQQHGSREDYWYRSGEGADSAARQLGERFNNSFDEFADAADTDEAAGALFDGMIEAIRNNGENAGLYDAILTAAFGESWTNARPGLTGQAQQRAIDEANTNTSFDANAGGYRDPMLNYLMGVLGYTAGQTNVTDITDAAQAAAKYNEAVQLYTAANERLRQDAEEAAAQVDDSALENWDKYWEFVHDLISRGAIAEEFLRFLGGDFGPLENLFAEAPNPSGEPLNRHGAQFSENNQYNAEGYEGGWNFSAGFAEGVGESGDAEDAAENLGTETLDALNESLQINSPSRATMQTGAYLIQGLALGIRGSTPLAVAAAREAALAAADAMREALDIHSPSQVMAALGAYVGEGFALGIAGSVDAVQAAVYGMAEATAAPVAGAAGQAGGNSYNSSAAVYVDKYYQNSAEDIGYIRDQLDDLQRRQLQGHGYGR